MLGQADAWGANGKAASSGGSREGREGSQKLPRGGGAGSGSPWMDEGYQSKCVCRKVCGS